MEDENNLDYMLIGILLGILGGMWLGMYLKESSLPSLEKCAKQHNIYACEHIAVPIKETD